MASMQIIGPGYIETVSGQCKIIGLISSTIATPLVSLDFVGRIIEIFQAAAITSSTVSFIFLVLYMSALVKKVHAPWNKFQMYFFFAWTIFYSIASILILYYGSRYLKLKAAGVFGFISSLAHLVDCINNYKKLYLGEQSLEQSEKWDA